MKVSLLDVSELLVVTEIFLIASGTSPRHVRSLVDDAEDALRGIDRKPYRREGKEHGRWVLLDYGDLVIHVFDQPTRDYYDLERLWADAPRVDHPAGATAEA
jgi:ribosome-associated protein